MKLAAFLLAVDSPWLILALVVGRSSPALGWLIGIGSAVGLLLLVAFMRGAHSEDIE